MGNFDRGNRGGGRSFGNRNFAGSSDRRGGFGDRRGADRGRGGLGGDRTMHHAVCSNCGRDCEVPFMPTSSKPVYCSDCFEKMGNDRGAGQSVRPSFQASNSDQNKNQLEALNSKLETMNAKLERILKMLAPEKAEAPKAVVPAVSVGDAIKEAKPLKVKKEVKKTTPNKKK